MAKGAISNKRAPSKHSRAARRATSPSINTDKSLKNAKPPSESVDHRPSILAIHQGAGVTKKAKRARNVSSKAKRRAEKGQDKALAIADRTEKKISKSKGQARTIQTRRKTWEDVNKQIPSKVAKDQGDAVDGEDDDEDVMSELDDEMGEAAAENPKVVETPLVPLPQTIDEDEDEIS